MAKQYVCFFITPIGKEGSEVHQIANHVYQMIVMPAMNRCHVRVLRADENASSNHIGLDVIQCIRDADICLADISSPNCNVYYELGLADAMNKPVILIKEESVDAASLPADISSRKFISYSLQMDRLLNAWNSISDFVHTYIQELETKQSADAPAASPAPDMHELLGEIYKLRRQLDERPSAADHPLSPALPMDLRPRQTNLPMQTAQKKELLSRLDKLLENNSRLDDNLSSQIRQLLSLYRETQGDEAYLRLLQKRCDSHIAIWQEYLHCAREWLHVDLMHCVLDLTWVRSLLQGVTANFMTEDEYQDVEAICDRVLAISSEYREALIINENGLERYYDKDAANYYRGLLAQIMLKRTGNRKYLDDTESFWFSIRACESSFEERLRFSKEIILIETNLLLADSFRDCGKLNDARTHLHTAWHQIDQFHHEGHLIRNKLCDAYTLSLLLDEALAEQIVTWMKEHFPEQVKHTLSIARWQHMKNAAAVLFRDIISVIPVRDNAIQLFKQIFSQNLHCLTPAKTLTATSEQIRQFQSRTDELQAFFKDHSEAAAFLQHMADFLKKHLVKYELREKVINCISQFQADGLLSNDELSHLCEQFPNIDPKQIPQTNHVAAHRKPKIDVYIQQLNELIAQYPPNTEGTKALQNLAEYLQSMIPAPENTP